nr:hypothetical protein [Clostridia bacterium]
MPDNPLGACISAGRVSDSGNISGGLVGTNDWTTLKVTAVTDENGLLEISLCLGHHFHEAKGYAEFRSITITEN